MHFTSCEGHEHLGSGRKTMVSVFNVFQRPIYKRFNPQPMSLLGSEGIFRKWGDVRSLWALILGHRDGVCRSLPLSSLTWAIRASLPQLYHNEVLSCHNLQTVEGGQTTMDWNLQNCKLLNFVVRYFCTVLGGWLSECIYIVLHDRISFFLNWIILSVYLTFSLSCRQSVHI